MPDPSDVTGILDQSACFDCIPKGMQEPVQTYLLALIAGGTTDPQALLAAAACYDCIPKGMQSAVQIYLLNQIVSSL